MVKRHDLHAILLVLGLSIALLPPLPLHAETTVTYHNPIVYTGVDGNLYMTSLDGTTATVLTTPPPVQSTWYGNTRWSPDGTHFVFVDGISVLGDEEENRSLYLAESGKRPVVLPNIQVGRPPLAAWSPDGKQLVFTTGDINSDFHIMTAPITGGPSTTVTTARSPCIGDAPWVPKEADLMTAEVGGFSALQPYFAVNWASPGILLGFAGCNLGFGLVAPDGNVRWSNGDSIPLAVGFPVVAPGGKQALWPYEADDSSIHIALLALATGKWADVAALKNTAPFEWTPDGKQVVYVTSTDEHEEWGQDSAANIGEQIFGFWPAWSRSATLTLWQAPIDGSSPPRHLFEREGYGIGALTVVPDGSAIVFSLVTSSARQIEAINAGASLEEAQQFDKPHVEVIAVRLDRPNAKPEWIALGGQPAAGKGTFEAVPAVLNPPQPVHCRNTPASRLMIGQRAKVTAGPSNNLREVPTSGKILAQVPAGAHFLVLAGPACGSDGLAWWQVNYQGTVGWVAEGKGAAYWLEP